MLDEAAVAAMTRLPKVELHCHVEGTMRPATVAELAARNGHALPTDDPTELYHYVSLDDFLKVFWLVQSTLGSRDDWTRLAYESVLDAAESCPLEAIVVSDQDNLRRIAPEG